MDLADVPHFSRSIIKGIRTTSIETPSCSRRNKDSAGNAPFAYILEEVDAPLLDLKQVGCVLSAADCAHLAADVAHHVLYDAAIYHVNSLGVCRLDLRVSGYRRWPEMGWAMMRGLLRGWLHVQVPPQVLVMLVT